MVLGEVFGDFYDVYCKYGEFICEWLKKCVLVVFVVNVDKVDRKCLIMVVLVVNVMVLKF